MLRYSDSVKWPSIPFVLERTNSVLRCELGMNIASWEHQFCVIELVLGMLDFVPHYM